MRLAQPVPADDGDGNQQRQWRDSGEQAARLVVVRLQKLEVEMGSVEIDVGGIFKSVVMWCMDEC